VIRNSAVAQAEEQVTDAEAAAVRAWRVTRLIDLGLPLPTADAIAGRVDWHDVAKLVARGCPVMLAVAILN
jgi:intergrase/recombinase